MAKLVCPECGKELTHLRHNYTVEIMSKFYMDEEGFTSDKEEAEGDKLDQVFVCPECEYETEDVDEFIVEY